MRVTAEKMVAGGRCLARVGGKAVFISGILPGEDAEIRIDHQKKDYDEASVIELVKSSPHRVEPACPAFFKCGGCSLMIAKSEVQHSLKEQILLDLLKRFKVEYSGKIGQIESQPFEYRSRFQFHKGKDGSVGLCASKSGRVVPVRDCPVAVKEIRALLANGELRRLSQDAPKERFSVFSFGGKTLVENNVDNKFSFELCKKTVSFDVRSFFQSNVTALEKTIAAIFSFFGKSKPKGSGGTFLDFYAGAGVFSLCSSDLFDKLYLIEENAASVAAARENLFNACPKNARVFMQRDSEWVKSEEAKEEFDAAIFDPPRGGIGKQAIGWLFGAKIKRLAYLSCNAPTFARDCAMLSSHGWILHNLMLCDFYPQTPHMEVLGFFSKNKEW